jgi:hypothetical protein
LVGLTAGIGWWMGVCASYNLDPEVHQQLGQGDVTRMTTDLFTLRLRPPRPGEVIVFETLTPVLEGPWISHGSGAPKPPPPVRLHPYARPRFARWTWQLGLSVSYGSRSVGRVTGREPGGWVVVSSLAEPPGPERLRVPQERVIGKVVWVR